MFSLENLLDTNDFPARWYCGNWSRTHGMVHIVSDLAIFGAYFAIPIVLIYFIRRRNDIPFLPIFYLFSLFILSCGIGHAIEASIFWQPWYRLSGLVKIITAIISWATVLALIPLVPRALALPGLALINDRLLAEINSRKAAEESLKRLNEELEMRVRMRTEQLQIANDALVKEIADKTRAQEAKGESEERFRLLVESVQDYAIFMIDPNGVVLSWNSGAERVIGYAESEIVGRHFSCFYPEEERREDRPALEILKATRTGKYHEENWRIRKDGTRFWADVTLTPMRNDTGRLRGFAKITRDITERKNAEDHIQKQLARLHLINQITEAIAERQDLVSIYRVVLSQLEDYFQMDFNAICSFDSHSLGLRIEAVGPQSQSLSDQLGLKIGQTLSDEKNWLGESVRGTLSYIPDLAEVDESLFQRMAGAGLRCAAIAPIAMGGKTMGLILTARRERDAYDSGDCEFLQKLSCHVFLAGQHAMLYQELKTAYDDLRQSQKHVLQQERLSALGQMASGIAHDINNAISPISLYVESLLEGDHQFSSQAREYLTTIARAIDDVAKTVSRMRDFYRLQEKVTDLHLVDLTSLTQQVLDLTRPRWRDQAQANGITIDLHCELAAELPNIMGVESEIRDAITNLIFNAVDAMPYGGTLSVITRPVCLYPSDDGSDAEPSHVEVQISDTGIGMDEETRRKCLEPFFTTKGERGTGLGLAMVYGTMRRHSGEIEVRSGLGKGTSVRLLFPISSGTVEDRVEHLEIEQLIRPLRILVVDDDILLRTSLQNALRGDGHLVTVADGGKAGIECFQAALLRAEPFEVVVTDLGMPLVDGREVAKAIKEKAPTTGVILLTGWGQRMKIDGDTPAYVDLVLGKPPKMRDLRGALAALI